MTTAPSPPPGMSGHAIEFQPDRGEWQLVVLALNEPRPLGYVRINREPWSGWTAWPLGRTAPLYGADGRPQRFKDRRTAALEIARELHAAEGWSRYQVSYQHPDYGRTLKSSVAIYHGDGETDQAIRETIARLHLDNPRAAARIRIVGCELDESRPPGGERLNSPHQ